MHSAVRLRMLESHTIAHGEILVQHHSYLCAHGCTESLEQIFIPIIVPCTKMSFHKDQTENLNIFVFLMPRAM